MNHIVVNAYLAEVQLLAQNLFKKINQLKIQVALQS